MQGHAARLAYRLIAPRAGQSAFIHRMAGFMQNPHDRRCEIILVIARRNAHIIGNAATERMMRNIQTAMLEIKTDRLHQIKADPVLNRNRERPGRADRGLFGLLAFNHFGGKGRQERFQFGKQAIDPIRPHHRVILIEKRVIDRRAKGFGLGFARLYRQVKNRLKFRQKPGKVIIGTRPAPCDFATGRRQRHFLHQIGRHRRAMHPIAFHFRQIGFLPRIKVFTPGRFDQIAHIGCGDQFIGHDIKGRQLLGPGIGPAIGHHRRHIPMQHAAYIGQNIDAAKTGFKRFIGVSHGNSCSAEPENGAKKKHGQNAAQWRHPAIKGLDHRQPDQLSAPSFCGRR